jgi:pyrroloquinoline quinone biosynthesis protein D
MDGVPGRVTGIPQTSRIRLVPKALLRYDPVRSSHVLLLPERAVLLNATAAEILELCDGTRTADQVVEELLRRYPAPEVRADVLEFLEEAAKKGWITWT